MFDYINGYCTERYIGSVAIEVQGLGYHVVVSDSTFMKFPPINEKVKLYLYPIFKEDNVALYGFYTKEEREIFITVISVSGVGPKVAMNMLSFFNQDEFVKHILNSDSKAIAKAPGIGIKTANRLILELKDKFSKYIFTQMSDDMSFCDLKVDDEINVAIQGLEGLGYSNQEATVLVNSIYQPGMSVEEMIKMVLLAVNTETRKI